MCYRHKLHTREGHQPLPHTNKEDDRNMLNHTKPKTQSFTAPQPATSGVRNYLVIGSSNITATPVAYIGLILCVCGILMQQSVQVQAGVSIAKGFPSAQALRLRTAKIANIHGYQVAAESIQPVLEEEVEEEQETPRNPEHNASKDPRGSDNGIKDEGKHGPTAITAAKLIAGKYEIRSVAGEPNYKSVNLTWEVEFVPAATDDGDAATATATATKVDNNENNDVAGVGGVVTNSSAEVEPPKTFQIFFCELQSFGPHRCRSKLVSDNSGGAYDDNANEGVNVVASRSTLSNGNANGYAATEEKSVNRKIRHYTAQIDNLRMATKYSFHIRPQVKRRNMKITARSEFFGNEIDNDDQANGGHTIIIPTKGFSAQATQCLPHASEIEVETGPYFGGKIVVDGGNCGIKGNPQDPQDKYMMRIDHKMCGSLVKPETNTVETFITVQENLGIFTHSTRRFVVVCSFQSGMQTVRASFSVPGKGGVAAAVENDPFEPDTDRVSREHRQMRYVDRSALILREPSDERVDEEDEMSEEKEAFVTEIEDPSLVPTTLKGEADMDAVNAVAILEDIVPGVNEEDIKHENEVYDKSDKGQFAKYAKLVASDRESNENDSSERSKDNEWFSQSDHGQARALASTIQYISANAGSVVITIAISMIILIICMFVIYREATQRRYHQHFRRSSSSISSNSSSSGRSRSSSVHKTLPRSLQPQQQQPCSM